MQVGAHAPNLGRGSQLGQALVDLLPARLAIAPAQQYANHAMPYAPVGVGNRIEDPPALRTRLRGKQMQSRSPDWPGLIPAEHAGEEMDSRCPAPLQVLKGGKADGWLRVVHGRVQAIQDNGIGGGFQRGNGRHRFSGSARAVDQFDQSFHGRSV
jgi:hypothetical protein